MHMHICLVSLDYTPYHGSGLAVYAEDLARGLREQGHAVTVLAALRPGMPALAEARGVQLRRVPIGPSDWIGYSVRAARARTQASATRARMAAVPSGVST